MDLLNQIYNLIEESNSWTDMVAHGASITAKAAAHEVQKNTGDAAQKAMDILKASKTKPKASSDAVADGLKKVYNTAPQPAKIPANIPTPKPKMSGLKKTGIAATAVAGSGLTGSVAADVYNKVQQNNSHTPSTTSSTPVNPKPVARASAPSPNKINSYWKTDQNGHVAGTKLTPMAYRDVMKNRHPDGTLMDRNISNS